MLCDNNIVHFLRKISFSFSFLFVDGRNQLIKTSNITSTNINAPRDLQGYSILAFITICEKGM